MGDKSIPLGTSGLKMAKGSLKMAKNKFGGYSQWSRRLTETELVAISRHLRGQQPEIPWPSEPVLQQLLRKMFIKKRQRMGINLEDPLEEDFLFKAGTEL